MRNDQAYSISEPQVLATQSEPFDNNFVARQLARNVRRLRNKKNITQDALAERCGIFRTYLSRIETGKCNPSLAVLVALAHALEVLPHILLMSNE